MWFWDCLEPERRRLFEFGALARVESVAEPFADEHGQEHDDEEGERREENDRL